MAKITVVANRREDVGLIPEVSGLAEQAEDIALKYDEGKGVDYLIELLRGLGHTVNELKADHYVQKSLIESTAGTEFVLNLAEGLHGQSSRSLVPTLLDSLGLDYFGFDPVTSALTQDKCSAKSVLQLARVPTPRWFKLERVNFDWTLANLKQGKLVDYYPVIVKPAAYRNSVGIAKFSVVHTSSDLVALCEELVARYTGDFVIEEYIDGRELYAVVTGYLNTANVVGVVELNLGEENIAGIEFKASNSNLRDAASLARFNLPRMYEVVCERAISAYKLLGCRDIARVDIRLGKNFVPYVIDINPLQSLHPEKSIELIAYEYRKISSESMVKNLLESFMTRCEVT